MTLRTEITAAIKADLVGSADFANPTFRLPAQPKIVLLSGTGPNQADVLFSDQRTLAASANEDIDLVGALNDPLGQLVSVAKLKALLIRAAAGNTNNVIVGGAPLNAVAGIFGAVTHTAIVPPGGVFEWAAPGDGITLTAGTADLFRIANSGAGSSVTYDIVAVGTSA